MDEVHYLISDASKKVDVEAHVLRYWEEELELDIPRNEMGHRYYTDLHIRLFKQVKNLKEKGYQLKAIKHALNQVLKKDGKAQGELSDEILERDMNAALKEFKEEDSGTSLSTVKGDGVSVVAMEEKMEQFQQIMNLIIGRALEVNNEKLSQDISCLVNEKMGKELEFLFQASDQKEEERFRQLDETLRSCQKGGQAEAAAAKVPFFKRRRFGRSGKSSGTESKCRYSRRMRLHQGNNTVVQAPFSVVFLFLINREWLFYSTFNFLTTFIFISLFLKKCVRMNLI